MFKEICNFVIISTFIGYLSGSAVQSILLTDLLTPSICLGKFKWLCSVGVVFHLSQSDVLPIAQMSYLYERRITFCCVDLNCQRNLPFDFHQLKMRT